MKALIFSDLHLHAHKDRVDRLQNCLDVLNWIFKVAKERQVDYIFFLGDLFHERAKIDVRNYKLTFDAFKANQDGCPIYLLVGNHDMYHKESWDINSVSPLSAINNVNIIEKPTQTTFGKTKIDWMPHTENPVREIAEFKQNHTIGEVFFGHMSVHGAALNTFFGTKSDVIVEYDNDMVPVDVSLFDDWKMTMLGHYHGAQHLNDKVEYVGSPLQLSYGEAFQQKHLILLDLETLKKEYIVNDFSPVHLIITPQDVEAELYKLDGNFIRLEVSDLTTRDLIDLRRKIVTENKVLSVDFKQKEIKQLADTDNEKLIENAKSILSNISETFQRYLADKGVPAGMDKDYLVKVGEICLAEQTSSLA